MELSLDFLGELAYTLPAALLIYLLREAVKNRALALSEGKEEENPFISLDLTALAAAVFTQVGWGSFLRYRQKHNFLSYGVAQLSFLVVILLVVVYARLKGISPESFTSFFLQTLISMAWAGFVCNLVPIPPFDAAYFYLQPLLELRGFATFMQIYKAFFSLLVIVLYPQQHLYRFLEGRFFWSWAGL
ncbi:MAG: hypothetical protein NZM25_07550 [Leptospiraceae bacterium]|nr:hypothetical protein [Leptospiraceae bacterium]MDW8305453.1 hypothetical protein [Leptospiraceae bacterium]